MEIELFYTNFPKTNSMKHWNSSLLFFMFSKWPEKKASILSIWNSNNLIGLSVAGHVDIGLFI